MTGRMQKAFNETNGRMMDLVVFSITRGTLGERWREQERSTRLIYSTRRGLGKVPYARSIVIAASFNRKLTAGDGIPTSIQLFDRPSRGWNSLCRL